MNMSDKSRWAEILGAVRNPLIFFALALLIIEAIIAVVVTQSNMRRPINLSRSA